MSDKKSVVIIGAGKTGRGFLARLMQEEGKDIVFIEENKNLVCELRQREGFTIHFFGGVRKPCFISNYRIYHWEDEAVAWELEKAEFVLVSVGGENLTEAGGRLKKLLGAKKTYHIITAENSLGPAAVLREAIERDNARVSESTVFCTTIEKEGMDIDSENYPYLQCNGELLEGFLPPAKTIKSIHGFDDFLTRKLYTYNAASCIIAYIGWQKGYRVYSEAANDPEILKLLDENYSRTNRVLCKEFGYDRADQEEFAKLSKIKFCDSAIADTVERNARDPARKLKPEERLIGPIKLLRKYNENPEVLERTAAAALLYDNPKEEKWQQLKREKKPVEILKEICGLDPEEETTKNILKFMEM